MSGVVLSDDVKYEIQRYSGDTLTAVVQMDNVGELLHSPAYKEASKWLASYVSGTVLKKDSEKFHESLKWYEKAGFLSASKQRAYEESMTAKGKKVSLAVSFATTALPYLTDAAGGLVNKLNFEKFFMSWMGYINQGMEITPLMISNTQNILLANDVRISREKITAGIQAGQFVSARLPHLSRANMTALNRSGIENMNSIAKMVVSTADLESPAVRDRALEFLEDVFCIAHLEAEAKLEDVKFAQEHLSQFVTFSSFDYVTFFSEFIASSQEAAKIGVYDAEMDVYAKMRKANKEKVVKIAKDTAQIGGAIAASAIMKKPASLMGCLKPAADIVKLSEGLMSSTLNPSHDPGVGSRILKQIVEQRKAYNMKQGGN